MTSVPWASVTVAGRSGTTASLIGTTSGSATVAVLGPDFCLGSSGASCSSGVRVLSGAFVTAGPVHPAASRTVSTT
ncbi:hypothetical protein ACFOWZ_28500, partial [Lentzea rhizosphaerae]